MYSYMKTSYYTDMNVLKMCKFNTNPTCRRFIWKNSQILPRYLRREDRFFLILLTNIKMYYNSTINPSKQK